MVDLGENAEYLGDGAYVNCDGYYIWIKTSDGISVTNQIALEPEVFNKLVAYQRNISKLNSI